MSNTEKKRNEFLAKVKNRTVTCISNSEYPWNPNNGKHNIMTLKDFSEYINVPLHRVERAAKNGFLQLEYIGDIPYVVNANGDFRIKGITYAIPEPIGKTEERKNEMPLSKNGKPYYTDEQYDLARNGSSALEYARSQGYDLIPKGRDYTLREHTSMVFTERGGWFWNSQNIKGGAIEFLQHYEHKSLVEAVLTLSGENIHTQESAPKYERRPEARPPAEKQPFVLPERNDNHKRAFAYLTKTRGIDPDIVSQCMKENKIYESKDKHNAVFVFQDNNGEAKGAFLRGTSTDPKYQFKGMAANSDRASSYFSFGGGKDAAVACVFEASIDALSCATLQKQSGIFDPSGRYYVATGGAGDGNFMEFLKGHPEVKSVILCQDNDAAGNKFAKDLGDKLRGMGYQVSRCLSKGKDFNEELQNSKSAEQSVNQGALPADAAKDATTHYESFVGRVLQNPAGELHFLQYDREKNTFTVRHACEPIENTDDTFNEVYTPERLAEVFDFGGSFREQFFDMSYVNTEKTSSIVAAGTSSSERQETISPPRRYGQDGERLWNGKKPEEFTEQDTRQFLNGFEPDFAMEL